MRVTALLTDTARGEVPGQAAGLELRHRQPARVEDRIRQAKATGLRNLPRLAGERRLARGRPDRHRPDRLDTADRAFADNPVLANCDIAAFRYRVLHAAARITHSARQTRLRIDAAWQWAQAIATGYTRWRAGFG